MHSESSVVVFFSKSNLAIFLHYGHDCWLKFINISDQEGIIVVIVSVALN